MKSIEEIQAQIKSGEIDEALEALHALLKAEPENVEAEMLLGTCCQLKGDSAAFNEIYEDVRPQMEARELSGEQSRAVTLWKRYKALWVMIFASACFLGGLVNRQMCLSDTTRQLQEAKSQFATLEGELRKERSSVLQSEGQVKKLKEDFIRDRREHTHLLDEVRQSAAREVRQFAARETEVVSKLRNRESELETTKSDLLTTKSELQAAKSELKAAKSKLQAVESKLQNVKNDYDENFISVRDYVMRMSAWEKMSVRESESELRTLDFPVNVSSLSNLCLDVLNCSEVKQILARDSGVSVFKLPATSTDRLAHDDYLMLLRLVLNEGDTESSIQHAVKEKLETLLNPLEKRGQSDNDEDEEFNTRMLRRVPKRARSKWAERVLTDDDLKTDSMGRLRRLIPKMKWWKVSTWQIGRTGHDGNEDVWWRVESELKADIRELYKAVSDKTIGPSLIVRHHQKEVILGFKFENTVYLGVRTKYGVPRDYGDRTPKRILAPDGTVIYQTDEDAIRRHYLEKEKRFDNVDFF